MKPRDNGWVMSLTLSVPFVVMLCWMRLTVFLLYVPQPDLTGELIAYPYSGKTKYYIAACFRMEGYYLEDWIKYHMAIGIDGFFLCDNNSGEDDLEYVERVKSQFANVEVINKRNLPYNQEEFYGEMYTKVGDGDWCFFIDIDEFVTFADGMSLYHYMSLVRQSPCHHIKLNWMNYGNNKEIFLRPGSVRDRFPHPSRLANGSVTHVKWNGVVKALLVGGRRVRWALMHYAVGRGMYGCQVDFVKVTNYVWRYDPVYTHVWLRHYRTRSEQEFCMKIRKWKGDAKHEVDYKWDDYNEYNDYAPNQKRTGIIGDDCNVSESYIHLLKQIIKGDVTLPNI